MTINLSDNTPRISYPVGAGVTHTNPFDVPFEFFEEGDLNVYVDGVLKTITTDYIVTGGSGSTGSISMTVVGASGGSTVVITRNIDLERTTDFPSSGPFDVSSLNNELDKMIAIQADLKSRIDRSIQASDYDEDASVILPSKDDRKGKLLAFNVSTGDVEVGATVSGVTALTNVASDIETLADIEDGTVATNGISDLAAISSDVTTVASNVSNVSNVGANILHVENVSNNMLSVTSAVTNAATANAALATFQESFNSGATAPTSPTDGDLWYDTANTQLRVYVASTAQWEIAGTYLDALTKTHVFTALAGQTSFVTDDSGDTLSIYTNGNTFVYKNGVRLTIGTSSTNDYYITGNTIVLNAPATLNDVLLVEVFTKFTSVQEVSLDQKVTDAATSATDAANSATSSANSLASIGSAVTDASNSAAAALASENNAASSESNASSSETAAAASAASIGNAVTQTAADAVATAADRVQTGLDRAATTASESAVSNDASQVSTDAAQVAADKIQTAADRVQTGQDVTAAANSASSASNSASTATTQASLATTNGAAQVALATTQATNAANSATAASNSATSIGNDATQTAADRVQTGLDRASSTASAAAAVSDASQVSTDAAQVALDKAATAADRVATGQDRTAANSSASAALNSQTNAAASAVSAASSANQAASSYDDFDDRYLGSKNTSGGNPTTDNDGNALLTGALMWDDTNSLMKVYNGSSWVAAYASSGGALINTNNLSDVSSASSARGNLGLGTAATTAASDYATAAQGSLASTALQSGDNVSVLTNNAGYLTSVPAQSFSSLTGKPTTISAYGITDAFDGAYGSLTGTPTIPTNNNQLTNGAGYITSVPAQSFSSLTSKPTTVLGYGITDVVGQFSAGTGITIAGNGTIATTVTATTSASDLTSGTLPNARFPSVLPALDGSQLTNLSVGGGAITLDNFTGDNSTTAFTLTTNPNNADNLLVTINGLMQRPTTDYTVSGTTLTFTTAPFTGANISSRLVGDGSSSSGGGSSATVAATGGDTVVESGGYKIHTFTSSGTFTVTAGGTVEYLVVAGGGGGGSQHGAGGGAGGYRSNVSGENSGGGISAETSMTVAAGSFSVVVGAGGAGATGGSSANNPRGTSGSDSVFNSITSLGGGGGGSWGTNRIGGSGGSGGGASSSGSATGTGGSGTSGQGFNGGSTPANLTHGGGGGGGAGAVGADSTGTGSTNSQGGAGGDGVSSVISGTSVYRGGGGGGGTYTGTVNSSGGLGGGGTGGGSANSNAGISAGTVNTGGGGGGSSTNVAAAQAGGSGVVIIRYAV